MHSRIYTGQLTHSRREPVQHAFGYPTYMVGLDIAELEALDRNVLLFGYNKPGLCSIWDRDYLDPCPGSMAEKLHSRLRQAGCEKQVKHIYLLTMPRVAQISFNPLSLFLCLDDERCIVAVVAEVRNTYKEAHLYILHEPHRVPSDSEDTIHYRFSKEFFVSPFNGIDGVYDLVISQDGENVRIELTLRRQERLVIRAMLQLRGVPFSTRALISTLLRYPFTAAMSVPRIAFQAIVLRFFKKLQPRMKPLPTSSMTIRAK